MTQPTLINLHPNGYYQEFHYYPFAAKSDRCVGSYNTLNDLSNKVCVPNKTEDLNLSVFNMITGINESKALKNIYHVNVNVNLMEKKCNSNQWWNNDKCRCECKKVMYVKKVMFGILLHCDNGKYLASIIDDSAIICDEVIDADDGETKTIPINFNEKKVTCKTQNFYILLAFLLITIVLLIAVSIYCYLIKY